MQRKKFTLSTTHIILLSFLIAVLAGSILLVLPISTKSGVSVAYIDALFTATTSVCVTGLVTLSTVETWSVFGQAVILVLIQIGGLGIITLMSGIMMMFNKRMGIGQRLLIQDSLNLNSMSGLSSFVKKLVLGTFIIEGIGALLYMAVFIPDFGPSGIWISVFTSVSAFCNAGIDIISNESLCMYATNPLINIVTSALIVLGGIGYVVWLDVLDITKRTSWKKRKLLKRLSLHTKLALCTTAVLIFGGALLIFIFEYNNPLTLGEKSFFDKIQISLFQSVTTRTAGFASVPQQNLTNASSVLSLLLMFIGGSPIGTAGGVKTVTFAVIILYAAATIRKKKDVCAFGRNISKEVLSKSVAVIVMSIAITFISTLILATQVDCSLLDILYETVSATATVGLSRGITAALNDFGKIIIIFTMYLGRVGPISLAIAFASKNVNHNTVKNPTEDISVG